MKGKAIIYLAAALAVAGASAWADEAQKDVESVTVTADPLALTGDLDPLKRDYFGFTAQQIARDIDPLDRYDAFRAFAAGLAGPLNTFYDWHGFHADGLFIPTHEFVDAGLACRDFVEHTHHHETEGYDPQHARPDDRPPVIFGTACREKDGWHFR